MAKIIPIKEHFQHFLSELKESFWGDLYGQTRQAWKRFFELESERERDRHAGWHWHGRGPRKAGAYRNGYYGRSFVTVFGTIRLRIARARGQSFLPRGLQRFQRRAPECGAPKAEESGFSEASRVHSGRNPKSHLRQQCNSGELRQQPALLR